MKKKIEILFHRQDESSKLIISINNQPTNYQQLNMSTTQITYNVTSAAERAHQLMILDSVRQAVEMLSERYGFDAEEAMGAMKISRQQAPEKKANKEKKAPAPKKMKPSIPLPFCGKVFEDTCCGIRRNHSLFTQCLNSKTTEGDYCKTCCSQASSNGTGKPNLGDIRDRMQDSWEPKGAAKVVSYGNVMEKLGISKEEAQKVAEQFGVEIPDTQFEVVKGKRGRPKKDSTASSSDDEDSKPKRPRGRPKTSKKVVSTSSGDDLIASLVKQQLAITADSTDSGESDVEVATHPEVEAPIEESKEDTNDDANAKAKTEAKTEAKAKAAAKRKAKAAEKAKAKAEHEAMAKAEQEAKAKAEQEAKAKAEQEAKAKAEQEETSLDLEELSDDSDEECEVEPVYHEGKMYYKNDEGEIIDVDDNSVVGEWNDTESKVELFE